MIRHVVLYTYRSDIPDATIADIYAQLDKISARLPGRLAYTWGKYQSEEGRNKGYTHALVTDFIDTAAQKAFLLDPIRLEFSQREVIPRMVNGVDGLVSFDFVWHN
ncbi:Dabb family protein [Legionella oakridgensis]|uniref:Endoglucanase Y n=2 Tax=Legionella oakridgensis TaxID=29423 RepID=W0BHN1_9GAMM|nr:Dabb family protein [Legionella oakridgensis]AHE68137.1 endoglucanase Y [Legionella oakridgensis ATCC 33761 = DSM 21215]ETO92351.1 endoglucanase Y [Legionella oakridgensis RV-2-2007]KTD37266.1 Stress responsive A/B barrel domain protein [Legionella oakridgensis]STY21106.1 Stress responsive A/B barrel domain protein [Legionella longbeachae]